MNKSKGLFIVCIFWFTTLQAQTGIDKFDFGLLQKLEVSRTTSETKVMRTLSDANNYVNVAVPLGLLVAGTINHDKDMQQNALYIATSSASTALINLHSKAFLNGHDRFWCIFRFIQFINLQVIHCLRDTLHYLLVRLQPYQ